MGVITAPPNISPHGLTAFYTTDQLLADAPVLILYGPAGGANATPGSSRIQCHVFTPAGHQSYPRLAISPSSSLYGAVNLMSRAEQGDEITRALAYSLFKYFTELSESVQNAWIGSCLKASKPSTAVRLFSDAHAAQLTSRLKRLDNTAQVGERLRSAFPARSLSCLDMDVVLPDGSVSTEGQAGGEASAENKVSGYGHYTALIETLGDWAFVPTSRVRRAPSRVNAGNRSAVFSRAQKESLRREMCELLDTEERYVLKIHDLVHQVASDFRQKARNRHASSKSPTEAALAHVFPPSLDEILRTNAEFLEAARVILEETENEAISDIETTADDGSRRGKAGQTGDATGATAFAQCLVDWFPKFSQCYGDFMKAHTQFGHYIRLLMDDGSSSFARRVQETGEQKLTSLLIEPVQRLPRYSLYVDNIARQLPVAHPALKNFLRAKDIISDICAQDQVDARTTRVSDRLKMFLPSWPETKVSRSRLVTAVDLAELAPPYTYPGSERSSLIALLFADSIALLARDANCTMTARSLLSELESQTYQAEEIQTAGLEYLDMVQLTSVQILELGEGSCIQMIPLKVPARDTKQTRRQQVPTSSFLAGGIRVFHLAGSWEAKASRLIRDIAKARVESRYSETEREDAKWSVREHESSNSCVGLFSAVVEESALAAGPATARIVIDKNRCVKSHAPVEGGSEVVASVASEGDGFYRLEVDAVAQHGTRDLVQSAELMPILCKRLLNALQQRMDMRNKALVTQFLMQNEDILRTFSGSSERRSIRSLGRPQGGSRPQSPVKAVANLFATQRDSKPLPAPPPASSVFSDIISLRPSLHNRSKSEVAVSDDSIERTPSKARLVRNSNVGPSKLSAQALEQTFDGYILALHARKGNVVGRSLASRKFANEASVNELYNVLLDEPRNALAHEQAAQSQVDVLFASFEKFLNLAWAERMGPLLSADALTQLRSGAETLAPLDYEELVQNKVEELPPQNQRALLAVIGMLIDLLEGTRNDSDRGALMMAVTEMVVRDKNAQEFVPVFDRLVEDYDVISTPGLRSGRETPMQGSIASAATRSTQAASFSSKASSFSKRIGRGILNRQNSKASETSSRFGSTRSRNMSGKSPADNSPHSILGRARSVELISHSAGNSRPTSRDRPQFLSVFDGSPSVQRLKDALQAAGQGSGSRHQLPLTPKVKRRSSLSDVHGLPVPSFSPLNWTPSAPLQTDAQPSQASDVVQQDLGHDADVFSPAPQPQQPLTAPARPVTKVTIISRSQSPVPLPVPRGVLSERPGSGNTPPPSQSPSKGSENASPRKLRAQSPTKFADRLHTQQESISGAKASLKHEIGKLGDEFAALGCSDAARPGARGTAMSPTKDQKAMANVATRLRALEAKVPHLTGSLERSLASLRADMLASMSASDTRVRRLEGELKEANAINEELFSSTQTELTKMFRRVKDGQGVEALRDSLRDSQDEATRLRRENEKLRKEVQELRARQAGGIGS